MEVSKIINSKIAAQDSLKCLLGDLFDHKFDLRCLRFDLRKELRNSGDILQDDLISIQRALLEINKDLVVMNNRIRTLKSLINQVVVL